jgi:predicted O-methyltransferase YrrM
MSKRMLAPFLVLSMIPAAAGADDACLEGHTGGVIFAGAQEEAVQKDVPFVPTREETVSRMLAVAGLTKDDVLYDLGSGDGRIVVTAAKKYGARAVGVDIDPQRIRESNENAKKAGVTDRVRFVQQNLFDADFKDATVVSLYLLPDVNLKLRPRLLRELRPGTRIVSHDFAMGEWQPDRTVKVGDDTVYLWVVPAAVEGTWTFSLPAARGAAEQASLTLKQNFQQVSGTLEQGGKRVPIADAKLEGADLAFRTAEGPQMQFRGRVEGATIQGTVKTNGNGASRAWTARKAGTTTGMR